ncbi:hypothetical protein [Oceanobacillus sp. CF4.6]|uniref:hypothetical protein n=1 Tax=Oceanobacillus sp. CF4.6 TaxID=3373080 RepID=UPI003EE7728C
MNKNWNKHDILLELSATMVGIDLVPLPLHDGSVLEIEQNYMIGKATSQYMVSDLNNALFPFLIQPWVSDEFNNKPDLLPEFRIAFEIHYNKE